MFDLVSLPAFDVLMLKCILFADSVWTTLLRRLIAHNFLVDDFFFRLITYFWRLITCRGPGRRRKVPRGVVPGVGAVINNSPN